MQISQVRLKGFRNFKDAIVNLTTKSLIIGCNEIGKSNFLFALRILLDRNLSLADMEPQDSDFYVYENTNQLEIQIKFKEVLEDCVLAKLREHVSDEGEMYLAYRATRDPDSKRKSYKLLVGRSLDTLTEIDTRFYLRVLNLKFMGSKRDLFSFIRGERKRLLQDAKESREEEEIRSDNETLGEIETKLDSVNQSIASLSYVRRATDDLNTELRELSFQNIGQEVVFDTGASDPSFFVDNLGLASKVGGRALAIGGDGRNNQIQLALWAARNRVELESDEEPLEVTIFCIEEPEAHLHPHQQRKLATYLANTLEAQVIITTHSPQIACEFSPSSIIRLYDNKPDTLAAGNGINPFIEQALIEFGYRLDVIPAEAFFCSVVLLVEGVSEVLFYRVLAEEIKVDLNRLNVSVLAVEGIGFSPYVSLLQSLRIPYIIRTDNDVFKVPKRKVYRFAGIQRGIKIYKDFLSRDEKFEECLRQYEDKLQGFSSQEPPLENRQAAKMISGMLTKFDIFVANIDLEHDLHDALPKETASFLELSDGQQIVDEMQKQKGTFMFEFLRKYRGALASLKDNSLAEPLLRCRSILEM